MGDRASDVGPIYSFLNFADEIPKGGRDCKTVIFDFHIFQYFLIWRTLAECMHQTFSRSCGF